MAGEFDLIAALRAQLPVRAPRLLVGSGDDAAVVATGGDRVVISVDTTVDGVHAQLELGDPLAAAQAFGWRALTTALSDLAAMGVAAGEAYVALGAPKQRAAALIPAIGSGLAAAAAEYGVVIAGGDLTAAPVVFASVTVCGWLPEGSQPVTRAGAQPGDVLGLTGPIGAAGAGLLLHSAASRSAASTDDAHAALVERHLRPRPRNAEAVALREAGASAMIDLSDGLLADARHLAQASGAELRIDPRAVPLAPGLEAALAAGGVQAPPLEFAQAAGEDFELLVTVPRARQAAAQAAGITHWIGEVAAGAAGVSGLTPAAKGGHDHFA